MEYVLLSELSLQRQNYKIRVRVCRIWESTAPFLKGDLFSLDCLLVDEKAYSMQGTIRKQDAEEVRCRLSEGSVYLIEKFNIIPTKKKFVAVDRLYMIQITKWTSFTLLEEGVEKIPLHSFNFLNFSQVEKQRYNDAVLTDVLGQVTAIGEITHKYVGQTLTAIRNLEIQDLERNVLSVTLWDKFALDFDDAYVLEKGQNNSIVIILAGMTVRSFKEKLYLSTCSASKLYIDLDIPDVIELRISLQAIPNFIEQMDANQEQIISPQEEMCLNRKNIAELLDLNLSDVQNTKFTCHAKIIEIDTSFGWWYKACYNCKTAIKTYDDTFFCSNCGENDNTPMPWYKLNAIVGDASGTTNFTIFGKIAQDLIRIPAQILATSPGSEQFTLPPAIKAIIGREHVFQVAPDTRKFGSSILSFRVSKFFPLNFDTKGKSPAHNLSIKCDEHIHSPAANKEICKELFTEMSPNTEVSLGSHQLIDDSSAIQPAKRRRLRSQQLIDDLSAIQPAKRRRLRFDEDSPTGKDTAKDNN